MHVDEKDASVRLLLGQGDAPCLRGHPLRRTIIGALISGCLAMSCSAALAGKLPEAGDVVVGDVAISQAEPSTMLLTQRTNYAALNWRSFNVRDNALLYIEQPSNASLMINRVTGSQPSLISGEIRSNGIVMLVNPNGITVTPSANIDGPAFLVSNKDMPESELTASKWAMLPRLLDIAAATSVNTDVHAKGNKHTLANQADYGQGTTSNNRNGMPMDANGAIGRAFEGSDGLTYDVHILANGRIISDGRSGRRRVVIERLPKTPPFAAPPMALPMSSMTEHGPSLVAVPDSSTHSVPESTAKVTPQSSAISAVKAQAEPGATSANALPASCGIRHMTTQAVSAPLQAARVAPIPVPSMAQSLATTNVLATWSRPVMPAQTRSCRQWAVSWMLNGLRRMR